MTFLKRSYFVGFVLALCLPLTSRVAFATCSTVWQPSNKELAASGWFSGNVYVGGKDRVSYDSGFDAVNIHQTNGIAKQLAEHRPETPWIRGNTAKLTVDVLFPEGFIPNKMSRLAIGLRGGADPVQRKISGGATTDVQDGWSLRINHDNKLRFYAYAYNLNRTSKFGGGPALQSSFPIGQWMTVELKATLNTLDLTDGTAALTIKNTSGRVHDALVMHNLVWRNSGDWNSFGLILTDMIKLVPAQDQSVLYRNFVLEVGDGKDCS